MKRGTCAPGQFPGSTFSSAPSSQRLMGEDLDDAIGFAGHRGVVTRVTGKPISAVQQIPYVNLVNRESAGASGISLTLVTIPVGGGCVPHLHVDSETALYLLSGVVLTRYGEKLEHEILTQAGEALYIAPGVPHSAQNIGSVPAIAVSARTDADEQERTLRYDIGGS